MVEVTNIDRNYDQIAPYLHTYDLIAFKGNGAISEVISEAEQECKGDGEFTHVGLVVRPRDLPTLSTLRRDGDEDKVYILEATAFDNVPTIADNKTHTGVQLRDLSKVVASYGGDQTSVAEMAWLPIKEVYNPRRDPEVLQRIIETYMGRSYDFSIVDLSAVVMPCMRVVRDNWLFRSVRGWLCWLFYFGANPSSWLFCSELCSQIYKDLNIFPKEIIPANISPEDIASNAEGCDIIMIPRVFGGLIRFTK